MAGYSTLFTAEFECLPEGFPGWMLPLPEPVTRTFVHPLFREEVTVTTREPEWPGFVMEQWVPPHYAVVAIEGDYGAYLEARLPPFVRSRPHWCGKRFTSVELNPLIALATEPDIKKLESAMFAHPSLGKALDVFPQGFVSLLAASVRLRSSSLRKDGPRPCQIRSTHIR